MSLYKYVDESWLPILKEFIEEPKLKEWLRELTILGKERIIYPKPNQIFRTFNVPIKDVKVVILGQDPYHTPGVANGLAFSSDKAIPPSLANIYKELELEGYSGNRTGDLTPWLNQGVLLLNTVLTVEAHKANSHKGKGWELLTDGTISYLNQLDNQHIVFLLWGSQAKQKAKLITNTEHSIITAVHPSPLSADKGWWNNGCFQKTNDYLISWGYKPIHW